MAESARDADFDVVLVNVDTLLAADAALREAEAERDQVRAKLEGTEERLRSVFQAYEAWRDKYQIIETGLARPDKPIVIVEAKRG